jgi:hypothetical protein
MELSGEFHALTAFTLGNEPPVPLVYNGWLGPRAGLDAAGNRIRTVQLYRLSHPAPYVTVVDCCNELFYCRFLCKELSLPKLLAS